VSRLRLLLHTIWVVLATPVGAQVTPPVDAARTRSADSVAWTNGWRAGEAAAEAQPVAGRAAAGFLGGLPVGLFGVVALAGRDELPVVAAGGGLAVIAAAARPGRREAPAAEITRDGARDAMYERAFARAYSERLVGRRRSAAIVGGLAGAATGLGLLLVLLSGS